MFNKMFKMLKFQKEEILNIKDNQLVNSEIKKVLREYSLLKE